MIKAGIHDDEIVNAGRQLMPECGDAAVALVVDGVEVNRIAARKDTD